MMRIALILVLSFALTHSQWAEATRRRLRFLTRHPANTPVYSAQSESLALEKILRIQDQRLSKDPYVINALHHPSPRVVQAAILALGRIGDPNAIEGLSVFLTRRDPDMKKRVAFSLGLIGGGLSYKLLSQAAAMEKDPDARGALYLAMGRCGIEATIVLLNKALINETRESVSGNIAEGIGLLWSGDSAKWAVPQGIISKLIALSKLKSPASISAAFALSRFKGEPNFVPVDELLDAISKSPYPFAQGLLCRCLAKIQNPNLATNLAALLVSPAQLPLKIEAAKALRGRSIAAPALAALKQVLLETNAPLLVSGLETIGSYGAAAAELQESVDAAFRNSKSGWVKSIALKALCRIAPAVGRRRVMDILQVSASPLYPAAVTSLVILGEDADLTLYVSYLTKLDSKLIGESLDAWLGLPAEIVPEKIRLTLKALLDRADMGLSSQIAELATQNKWKDFAAPLANLYPKFKEEDQVEVKISLLNALGSIGSEAEVSLIEQCLKDNDKLVVTAAVGALKALTGKDYSSLIPINSTITQELPAWTAIQTALNARVVLKTTRGEIEVKMAADTPVTSYHFVNFARTHFYEIGRAHV